MTCSAFIRFPHNDDGVIHFKNLKKFRCNEHGHVNIVPGSGFGGTFNGENGWVQLVTVVKTGQHHVFRR
jgi:hypothetical protein